MLVKKNDIYFIAEAGINHSGSLKKAIKLIDDACEAEADAIKFQTYITKLRAPKNNMEVFDILQKCELKHDDFKILKDYADEKHIQFFSTPFDIESAVYLKSIDVDVAKIASFDTTNLALIEKCIDLFQDLIISTGMTSIEQINNVVNRIKEDTNLIILHCISSYPMAPYEARLTNINTLKNLYNNHTIGYSDHSSAIEVPLYAIAAGAQVIEKHFMLENDKCVDEPVSITKNIFKNMVTEGNKICSILGKKEFGVRDVEKNSLVFRRYWNLCTN